MTTRDCPEQASCDQATLATGMGYTNSFAFASVTIKSFDQDTNKVTFYVKGATTPYTAQWKDPDIWTGCPTTINSPDSEASGTLLIGEPIYNDPSFSPARPYTSILKWPIEGGFFLQPFKPDSITDYIPLKLSLNSINIVAAVPDESYRLEFELLSQACQNDILDLHSVFTTLSIQSRRSAQCVPAKLQILSAIIQGQNTDIGIEGQLDILDPLLSDPFQIIDLTTRSSISIRLSQRGLSKFGAGDLP